MSYTVDVVIAVHTGTRPISRAVSSVLDHTKTRTRVTVVAHNIDPQIIRGNLGSWAKDDRVRVLSVQDGIASPAGPMNLGLAESSAGFIALLGSDDEFQPGAIDSWIELQQQSGAEIVIAQVRHEDGGKELSPPARPKRQRNLDPIKDRLSYRSAPLGLISRELFGDLRFVEGLRSGEDIPFVARLWFSGARIAFARSGPGYLVHADAVDRVTAAPRSIAEDFAFLGYVLELTNFDSRVRSRRTAVAVKLIRVHLFDAIVNRASIETWDEGEREALAGVARRVLAWAPHVEQLLSQVDRAILDGVLDAVTPVGELMALIRRRWNYRSADVLLTRNPFFLLHRQGPLRTYVGGYFV